jgi:tRNA threonylcarbamoyladenosine biosynthesis protein TsaB
VNQTQLPDACLIAQIAYEHWQAGGGIAPEHAAPLYLRDKVAFTSAERAAGEGGNPKADKLVQAALLPMMRHDLSEVFSLECSVQSFPWTLKNFDDALAAGYEAWVLRSELGLLGFCVAMAAPDVTHILVIAVARDAQRQGYASHLLEHVSRNAKARSAEGLLLEVRPSNTDARIFYEKAGFQQIGLRKNYYPAARGQREDALILKKTFVDA